MDAPPRPQPHESGLTRRSLLIGGGAVAATLLAGGAIAARELPLRAPPARIGWRC